MPRAPTSSTPDRNAIDENIGRSLGTDYFLIADQLTREEHRYLRRTRDFAGNEVLPVINGYWKRADLAGGCPRS